MSVDLGFGIVRGGDLQDARAGFEELCSLVSKAAGVRFSPVVVTTYRELTAAIERGEVGLAWLSPVPTIELESRGMATVLAVPSRSGTTSYHSALIVRRGGPKTLVDLKGRRAAWVERDSAAGYLVPRMHLAAEGFDVLRFFARELFVHSHGAVIDAVLNGEVDVGASYCHLDANGTVIGGPWLDASGHSSRPIDTLATMGPIPNDALVGATAIPAAIRSALTRWLLGLEPSSSEVRARELFASLLQAGDFRVPASDHYDALRHALRAARARGHDALPPSSRMRIRVAR